MLPFGIGLTEVLLIAVVALLVVGPRKLPEMARNFGQILGKLRHAAQSLKDAVDVEPVQPPRIGAIEEDALRDVVFEPSQAPSQIEESIKPAEIKEESSEENRNA